MCIRDSVYAGTTLNMGGAFYQQSVLQPKMHVGFYVGGTTDSLGRLVFNHGCPFTPRAVIITMRAATGYFTVPWGSYGFSSTGCAFRFMHANGGAYASASTGAF